MTSRYNFRVGGRTHLILSCLEERSAHIGHIARYLGLGDPPAANHRRRLWRRIAWMEREGLICRDGGNWFHIAPHGAGELEKLGPLPGAGRPGARIFVGRAA